METTYLLESGLLYTPKKASNKIKALIIEDESDICYLLSNILKQWNIDALFAGSLAEADKILLEHSSPGIIFLDNHLPDGRGINYIRRLKEKSPSSKIVMITAHDNLSDREKARNEGADFFIGKPFSKELIFKTLENLTGQ
ncbi:MAG: response regulator [Bacteroidota bacterium]